MANVENVVEFLRGNDRATCSFSQGRFISRIKKLAEQYPDECQIVAENNDGSITAHFPVKWLLISNRSKDLTDEERQILSERARENFRKED